MRKLRNFFWALTSMHELISIFIGFLGVVCLWLAIRLAGRRVKSRGWSLALAGIGGVLGLAICSVAGIHFWFFHRSQPASSQANLFQGVVHIREVRKSPRPMVINIVRIDLHTDGIEFVVTQECPTNGMNCKARTASDFLKEFHCQIAVNANYFYPFSVHNPLAFYPKRGEGVNPSGTVAAAGKIYGDKPWGDGVLYLSKNNDARFSQPIGEVYNAVNGNGLFLIDGVLKLPAENDAPPIYARNALALDQNASHIIIVTIDGRQPGYSEGATLSELAEIILANGGVTATRLDEGGSVAVVAADSNGKAMQLNSPIHTRIPGRERPAAVHLGVRAKR